MKDFTLIVCFRQVINADNLFSTCDAMTYYLGGPLRMELPSEPVNMLFMAKKPEKRTKGRPRKYEGPVDGTGRTGYALSVRIDPSLGEKINEFRSLQKKKTGSTPLVGAVVEMALFQLFKEHGLIDSESQP